MGLALIFPGQGSQKVGMGKDLAQSYPEARQVFEEVNDSLGQKLSKIIFDGPSNELMITENAQPALMAVSIAIIRILEIDNRGILLSKKFHNMNDMKEIKFLKDETTQVRKKNDFIYSFLSSLRQKINDPLGKRKK